MTAVGALAVSVRSRFAATHAVFLVAQRATERVETGMLVAGRRVAGVGTFITVKGGMIHVKTPDVERGQCATL